MEDKILSLLRRPNYTPLNVVELLGRLGLPRHKQRELDHVLARLERSGQIARIKQGNRYALPLDADLVPGRIRMNRAGVGFLQPDDPKIPTMRVPQDATATAMHGDHVLVRCDVFRAFAGGRSHREPTGRVVRVLERARTQLVGTLQRGRQFLYVIPDDPRIGQDIYVPPPSDVGRPGTRGGQSRGRTARMEFAPRQSRRRNHRSPRGARCRRRGHALGHPPIQALAAFPEAGVARGRTLSAQKSAGRASPAARIAATTRSSPSTPPTRRISTTPSACNAPGHGQWKLWVHIADVSHYVKPGTALDEEAARRGNSTYLVDRVIPMLPEALSNELCSLKPHVDRLTKCVEFLISAEGQVLKTQFYSAVIRSQCRYSYEDVLAILHRAPRGPARAHAARRQRPGAEDSPRPLQGRLAGPGLSGNQDSPG